MFAADSRLASAPQQTDLRQTPAVSWKQIIEPVEPFLDEVAVRLAQQVKSFDPAIAPYADYALNGRGKQLRPALVALAAAAVGTVKDDHLKAAVIIEMVHLATLVHDDIMDEAEIRRGRLTLASQWGNDIAVLFGDCLFARALTLAAEFPTTEVCRAVASATNTVCTGEILQTRQPADFSFTRTDYFKVLEMKTAELFALSCDLGAYLSRASQSQRQYLRHFGLAFGTAYQVFDDCVDLFGSEAVAGKSLGTDLAKGKLTLPLLLAWERASAKDRMQLRRLVEHWQPASMDSLADLLARYKTLAGSIEVMGQYLRTSRAAVLQLPASAGRDGLLGLTDYLARQTESLGTATADSP